MYDFSSEALLKNLDYASLLVALEEAFQSDYQVPSRHHHDFSHPGEQIDSTLLLMPAWEEGQFLGVKIVTVSPHNTNVNLPSIHGVYLLFNAQTGIPVAQMEAKTLTSLRTAAASALASRFLSNPDSKRLLMVGTGALAPHLIRAHASVRPIEEVFVWGRNFDKAKSIVDEVSPNTFAIQAIDKIESVINTVDIISCATLSKIPLINGALLRPGQHLDLVGSYKPDMREADDLAVKRCSVFVDTIEGATKESGDIFIPLQNGILCKQEIKGDLFDLCRQKISGRVTAQEITLFKSVGHALEDLAAAKLAFQRLAQH